MSCDEPRRLTLPFNRAALESLRAGEACLLTGPLFTLRDAGHLRLLEELDANNVHINIFGDYSMLPKASVDAIDKMIGRLENNDGLIFNIALNYGGRDEVARSVREIAAQVAAGEKAPEDITEDDISAHLWSGSSHFNVPDVDLIIRTAGDFRISNFLLWQSAYSELAFTNTLWPDFTEEEYASILENFGSRERRFGGRKEEDK